MNETIKELLKPRTIFAFMLYGSVVYLSVTTGKVPDILADAFFTLMGFYFGQKLARAKRSEKEGL